ncbi:MAG: glycine C-acetyltransferase [Nitrospiraceae bacterium]|uniref:glycine C-acetyltransferase n=1 Tax=Nitrospira cf. moscoviensis SBR1015 TaxID=96242 RepID=UPI000A0EC36F|nr:glycine C-acetyltransferase [Nitrospira cf. moscoviensis SBR1015]MBY0246348.1 glycine C-acetyltransferase [Nitrospiraceae bacterium]OQW38206.1 MAG: glycine C-acetyltransferase [Nitrospira sp. SG-bin2]
MAYTSLKKVLQQQIADIRAKGLYKSERRILGPQGPDIRVDRGPVLNLCANNYLGLANHPEIVQAAVDGLKTHGYGMASVRFICGTQDLHKRLERAISEFLGTEDTILYSSCFDANGGLFEALVDERDAVISDALNHASLIDGIRLCKATRLRYAHSDMGELEGRLKASQNSRLRLIVTDGVFSMDGDLARLDRIVDLAERYDAAVVVDDSHATGVLGPRGRGTPAHYGLADRVDIVTSTLGKTLGGATGGFTSSRAEIVELLRQRSRPYLFSNALPPVVSAGALRALDLVAEGDELRERLHANAVFFRAQLTALGFRLIPGEHPIIPVMLGEAALATSMAEALLSEAVYVVGFSYPVVPDGQARIRVQMSAAHTRVQLERAVEAFAKVGRALAVIQ